MKATILARVSTEEQKEKSNSLLAQTKRLKSYCKRKNSKIAILSFDKSAYKTKLDNFNKILKVKLQHTSTKERGFLNPLLKNIMETKTLLKLESAGVINVGRVHQ